MKKLKKYSSLIFGFIIVCSVAFAISEQSLSKGQIVKQFFAYSITQSLQSNHYKVFETSLMDCNDQRQWVEEPPVFHVISSLLPKKAQAYGVSLMSVLLILFCSYIWLIRLYPNIQNTHQFLAMAAVATCPIYLRYSIQHIPDLLASALLVLGTTLLAFYGQYIWLAVFVLLLAVTSKFLVYFPLVAIFFLVFRDHKFQGLLYSIIIALPFVAWLSAIYLQHIPSPFVFNDGIQNRHSGGLALLLDYKFYARFFTWTFFKGIGFPLVLPLVLTVAFGLRSKIFKQNIFLTLNKVADPIKILLLWSFSIVPYWLFIRQGNYTHDYYTLPFAFPLIVLCCIGMISILRNKLLPQWLIHLMLLLHAGIGVVSAYNMKAVPDQTAAGRPLFCQAEK